MTLANLATRLHSCNLFALITVQYVIIPSSLLLCEDVCQFLLELSPSQVFWTFRVFSGLTFPTFCVLDSPFGSSFVFGIVCWKIFSCSTVDYFSRRFSLARPSFRFEFSPLSRWSISSVLDFTLKEEFTFFPPSDLKGFFTFVIIKKLSPLAWSSFLRTLPGWCSLCLDCLLGSPVNRNSTSSPS